MVWVPYLGYNQALVLVKTAESGREPRALCGPKTPDPVLLSSYHHTNPKSSKPSISPLNINIYVQSCTLDRIEDKKAHLSKIKRKGIDSVPQKLIYYKRK